MLTLSIILHHLLRSMIKPADLIAGTGFLNGRLSSVPNGILTDAHVLVNHRIT